MPFLSDGLGVKIPFQGVLNDRFEEHLRMVSIFFFFFFHVSGSPESVPWSLELSYHLLSFVHIQVRYDLSHRDMKPSRDAL